MSINIKVTSDGHVDTYDTHGVKIDELSGDLRMLHKLLKINQMSADKKRKLPKEVRVRSATFYFVRDDTGESMIVPTEHMSKFVQHIDGKDVDTFIEELIMNSLNT
jgi:hypothetical protein